MTRIDKKTKDIDDGTVGGDIVLNTPRFKGVGRIVIVVEVYR